MGIFTLLRSKNIKPAWCIFLRKRSALRLRHFDLEDLLPKSLKSIRSAGSLITPPYSENVNWNVLIEPIAMSRAQIRKFVTLFSGEAFPHGNRRPVQPVNSRAVLTDARP